MITWQEDIIKIAYEDGMPVAILYENGNDTFFMCRKASKQEKGELIGVQVAEKLK